MRGLFGSRSSRAIVGVIASVFLFVLLFSRQDWLAESFKTTGVGRSDASHPAGEAASPFECARSFDGKRPVTQHVVMVDAGSSGSRVHVYEFNNCLEMPRLVREEFKMIDGGLSSYDDPVAAAESLDVLLNYAVENIPTDEQKCSPIAVKATAGLRKLGDEKSRAILDAVEHRLHEKYPFPVVEDGVSIMPGTDEGVYAWVTANYLLQNIGTPKKTPTVAVFDLGGGSTQIVFEPTFNSAEGQLEAGEHKYELSFGGRDFTLYQHSYLGYGLNEARSKINNLIIDAQTLSDAGLAGSKTTFINPCLPPNATYRATALVPDGTTTQDGRGKAEKDVTFVGPSVPSPLQCRGLAEKILDKEAMCAVPPCAFGGVYQPPLFEAFPRDSDLYVFSFFYDRTFPLGMPQSFTIDDLRDLTYKVCSGSDAYSAFAAQPGAVDLLTENPQWCLDLSYMLSLLHTGYDINSAREVRIAKKINSKELGWCLGASLPLLDGINWKCKEI